VNKDYDWHGKPVNLDNPDRTRFGVQSVGYEFGVWEYLRGPGAWPREAECPAGWDERDALV
jgi:hypothetical protein